MDTVKEDPPPVKLPKGWTVDPSGHYLRADGQIHPRKGRLPGEARAAWRRRTGIVEGSDGFHYFDAWARRDPGARSKLASPLPRRFRVARRTAARAPRARVRRAARRTARATAPPPAEPAPQPDPRREAERLTLARVGARVGARLHDSCSALVAARKDGAR